MRANGIADGHDDAYPHCATRKQIPLLARFASKFMLDILPAALASVIGGFLFTQYQFGRTAPPQPALEQISPASAEVLALVRDEHAAIISYLDLQTADFFQWTFRHEREHSRVLGQHFLSQMPKRTVHEFEHLDGIAGLFCDDFA